MAQAQYAEYDNDYDDEEDQVPLDDDGEPIPSPEEVRQIINSINSFKYEEKQPDTSGAKGDAKNDKESCAICLDDLQTG